MGYYKICYKILMTIFNTQSKHNLNFILNLNYNLFAYSNIELRFKSPQFRFYNSN